MTLPRNVRGGRWPAISQSGHGSYEYISAPNHPLNFNQRILLYNTRTLSRLLMSKSRHKYHRTSTLKSFRLEHRQDSACILSTHQSCRPNLLFSSNMPSWVTWKDANLELHSQKICSPGIWRIKAPAGSWVWERKFRFQACISTLYEYRKSLSAKSCLNRIRSWSSITIG